MDVASYVKSLINKAARRYGYRVERIIEYGKGQLEVFQVLVDLLNPRDPDFFFVQVGAHDGRTGDPIHRLVDRYHWRGLLLEPQPVVFALLADNYRLEPQLILENAALAKEDGDLAFYTVAGASYLGSFDRGSLLKRARTSSEIIEVSVRGTSFRSLVDRHEIRRVDLMVIDTEGFDFEVIKMAFNDGLPRPRLIRYEHLHLSPADRNACAELLVQHKYRLLRDGIDTIALLQVAT